MVSEFSIFIFFSWFLNVIFRLMLFPLNNFVKASNNYFGVFKYDTWGMRWSLIESAMILLALAILLLWASLASSPYGSGTSLVIIWSKSFSSRIEEILYFRAQTFLEVIKSTKIIIKLGVMSHFEMRTSNGNNRDIDLTDLGARVVFEAGWPRVC